MELTTQTTYTSNQLSNLSRWELIVNANQTYLNILSTTRDDLEMELESIFLPLFGTTYFFINSDSGEILAQITLNQSNWTKSVEELFPELLHSFPGEVEFCG